VHLATAPTRSGPATANATIDGNSGGKLVRLGAGNTNFISHAGTLAADTVTAALPCLRHRHGNLLATGQFGSLDLDPASGTTSLLGVTGHVHSTSYTARLRHTTARSCSTAPPAPRPSWAAAALPAVVNVSAAAQRADFRWRR